MNDVSQILAAIEAGDAQAANRLLPLVYDELRKLAAQKMTQEKPGQTLQPTALVHEAYLRLLGSPPSAHFDGRGHFFAAATEAMRRILIEQARRKKAQRHGGDRQHVELEAIDPAAPSVSDDLLALDEALDKLASKDPSKANLVKLRYFAGLTMEQIAEQLGISLSTAHRHWNYARAWLHQEIAKKSREFFASNFQPGGNS
jgi:RNA polymerase sigma factor (TIGR02999 family)